MYLWLDQLDICKQMMVVIYLQAVGRTRPPPDMGDSRGCTSPSRSKCKSVFHRRAELSSSSGSRVGSVWRSRQPQVLRSGLAKLSPSCDRDLAHQGLDPEGPGGKEKCSNAYSGLWLRPDCPDTFPLSCTSSSVDAVTDCKGTTGFLNPSEEETRGRKRCTGSKCS